MAILLPVILLFLHSTCAIFLLLRSLESFQHLPLSHFHLLILQCQLTCMLLFHFQGLWWPVFVSFHLLVPPNGYLTFWILSTHFGTCSYQCSLSNFTPVSLQVEKCSWLNTHYPTILMQCFFVSTAQADIMRSIVLSNCWTQSAFDVCVLNISDYGIWFVTPALVLVLLPPPPPPPTLPPPPPPPPTPPPPPPLVILRSRR